VEKVQLKVPTRSRRGNFAWGVVLCAFLLAPLPASSGSANEAQLSFEFEGNVATSVNITFTQPTNVTILVSNTWSGIDYESADFRAAIEKTSGYRFMDGGSTSSAYVEVGTSLPDDTQLYPTDLLAGEIEHCCLGWDGDVHFPGDWTFIVAGGSSREITHTSVSVSVTPPPEALSWSFTRDMGFMSVRNMDDGGQYARASVLGIGAGVSLQRSKEINVQQGLWGFSGYVQGGLDVHQFEMEGPEGTSNADFLFLRGETPGTYDFRLAQQLAVGDRPGRVGVIWADFPPAAAAATS
jgi:hypothetical protein